MAPKTGQLSAAKKSFYFLGMIFFLLFSVAQFGAMFSSLRTAQVVSGYYIYAGGFGLSSVGSLFASFLCGYKASRPLAKQKWIKKKLVNSATISFILGMFVIVGFPGFNQYALRAMNSQAKSDLHNLYQSCGKYWETNGKNQICSKETVANPQYGFVQSDHILIKGQGTSKNFKAAAEHSHTRIKYTIDSQGNIAEKPITF